MKPHSEIMTPKVLAPAEVADARVFFSHQDQILEILASHEALRAERWRKVKVHIGESALSRDLVWCECGRGLSRTGSWIFCPKCGSRIDQDSYALACAEAEKNGAGHYSFHDADLLNENARLRGLIDGMECQVRCAKYDYFGVICEKCGVGEVHARGLLCPEDGKPHSWITVAQKPCNCVKSKVDL